MPLVWSCNRECSERKIIFSFKTLCSLESTFLLRESLRILNFSCLKLLSTRPNFCLFSLLSSLARRLISLSFLLLSFRFSSAALIYRLRPYSTPRRASCFPLLAPRSKGPSSARAHLRLIRYITVCFKMYSFSIKVHYNFCISLPDLLHLKSHLDCK